MPQRPPSEQSFAKMITASQALNSIPLGLRQPLIDCYNEVCRNYAQSRWEPAELNGGKFSEVVYTIIEGTLTGNFASAPSKPQNFATACRALEAMPSTSRPGDRSLRILIPRVLVALYEIRNNRGVGHVGGDVNPNHMDSTLVHAATSWVIAELIRVFHSLTTTEAQSLVDALVERKLPIIWDLGEIKRVLSTAHSAAEQTLLLLYSEAGWVLESNLVKWVEYGDLSKFRSRILLKLHQSRMIEYSKQRGAALISQLGISEVETNLIK
jgi:hypothetical protein